MKKIILSFCLGAFIFGTVTAIGVKYTTSKVTYPILKDGKSWSSDKDVLNVNGSTYLPLTSVANLLGAKVYWNQDKFQVEIGNTSNCGFIQNASGDYVGTFYDDNGVEIGTYTGALKNGVPHGYGQLTFSINQFSLGKTYSGTFQDGIINGYGILEARTGIKYEGNFIYDKYTAKLLKSGPFKVTPNVGNSYYDYFDILSQL